MNTTPPCGCPDCDCGYTIGILVAELNYLRQELRDSIDGGDECRGHDAEASRLIRRIDAALARAEATSSLPT
jgi:hypothetical protein